MARMRILFSITMLFLVGCSSTLTIPVSMVEASIKQCENHRGLRSLTVYKQDDLVKLKLESVNCKNKAWFYSPLMQKEKAGD